MDKRIFKIESGLVIIGVGIGVVLTLGFAALVGFADERGDL